MRHTDSYANIISDEPPVLKYALAASQSPLTFYNLFIDIVQVQKEDYMETDNIKYILSWQWGVFLFVPFGWLFSVHLWAVFSKVSHGE